MNAPVQIHKPKTASAHYAPVVRRMMPGCEGREMQLRCSLLYMRDHASACLRAAYDEPAQVLEVIERLGTTYAYASLPLEALETLRSSLVRMVAVASDLQRMGGEWAGGDNARG